MHRKYQGLILSLQNLVICRSEFLNVRFFPLAGHVGADSWSFPVWRDQRWIIVKGWIAIKVLYLDWVLVVSVCICINVLVWIWSVFLKQAFVISTYSAKVCITHLSWSTQAESFSRAADVLWAWDQCVPAANGWSVYGIKLELNWNEKQTKSICSECSQPLTPVVLLLRLFLSVIIEVDKTTVFRVAFREQGGNSGIMKLRGRKLLFWETCFVKAKEGRGREVRKIN